MDTKDVERNLLYGLVALKMGQIDGAALVAALRQYAARKDEPIGQILIDQKALGEARLFLIEATFQELLDAAGGDPRRALGALRLPLAVVPADLGRLQDPALRAALGRVELERERDGGADDIHLMETHFDPQLAAQPAAAAEVDPYATQVAPGSAGEAPTRCGDETIADNGDATAALPASASPSVSPPPTLEASALPTAGGTALPTSGSPSLAETQDLYATRPLTAGTALADRHDPLLPKTEDAEATRSFAGGEPGPTVDSASTGPATKRVDRAAGAAPAPMRYRALRAHAKGGLGEVFVALDEELGREVALKEIQNRHADRPESRARFLIEAEVTGGLEHPGIVPVYGLGKYPDGRPYYAMRFIRGRTLKEAIDAYHDPDCASRDPGQRSLELRALLNRLIDVCNAMAYAHTRGILHRDIKPANIMLGAFGETLVVDWGLAKAVDRPETMSESDLRPLRPLSAGQSGTATMYGSTVGTPNFMSPEQAGGELDRLGPASDIYSIGATLYCILVGRVPFHEPQISLLLNKVRRGDFPHPRAVDPQVPRALEAICLKAMALEPEDRYATARDLADDLEHWLADEPVSVYREPWTTRLARWARRHKTLVTTGAALVLTALVALAIGTVLIKREQARTELNFRMARDAVDEMLTRLGEVELADVPQMEPVRKRMLTKAKDFYQQFLAQRGDDRSVRQETGRANIRLGDIAEMLGDYAAAEPAYRRAIGLLGAMAAENPGVAGYRRDLASARHKLGVLLKKSNRFTEAIDALSEARRLRGQLVAEFPGNPDDTRDEMDSVYQLGTVLARVGRLKEVEQAYTESIEAERKLAAEHPDQPDYPRKLGRYLNNRGILLRNISRDPAPAETTFREALSLQKPLAEKSPTVAGLQWERARTMSNLAGVLQATQNRAQSFPVYREAFGQFKRLADDFPSVPDYQNEMAVVASNFAMALHDEAAAGGNDPEAAARLRTEASDRLADAALVYRQLIQPDRFPHRPDFRQKLALVERRHGIVLAAASKTGEAEPRFRAAVEALKELEQQYPQVPEYQSDLGVALQNLARNQWWEHPAEARQLAEESIAHQRIALSSKAKDPFFRKYVLDAYKTLEIALDKLGDHSGAAAAADALARLVPDDPDFDFRAASLLSLSAKLVAVDKKMPEPERQDVAGARAQLALKQLRKAISEKAKLLPKDLDEPVFDAIRQHDPKALELLKKSLEARATPAVS
jgi:serine/threonine-protein kinase